jgi:hypothetical protein
MNSCSPKSPTPSVLRSKEEGFKPLSLGSWPASVSSALHYRQGEGANEGCGIGLYPSWESPIG